MLQNRITGCSFLDLFSGSGAIGIEALSRGAREAVFIEKDPKAYACIRDNLAFTRLADRARVLRMEVVSALGRMEREVPFDIIFMDPPYGLLLEKKVLELLSRGSLAGQDTLIIAEASADTDFSYLPEFGYVLEREKCYKTNKHIFIRKGLAV